MASNDAKSYIATVLARADGATKGPWSCGNGAVWPAGEDGNSISEVCDFAKPMDAAFIAASRQDIPTLAKIALRAIEALEEYDDASEFPSNRAAKALADINALAAKGKAPIYLTHQFPSDKVVA